MAAKTRGDFQGLLNDLPDLPAAPSDTTSEPAAPPAPGSCAVARRHQQRGSVVPGLLLLAFAVVAWHHLIDWGGSPLPWLVVLAAVVIVASRTARRP
jgi:hypothetical protein